MTSSLAYSKRCHCSKAREEDEIRWCQLVGLVSTLILPPPPGTFQPRSVVSLLRSAPYSCALAIKVGHLKQSPEPVERPGFLSRLCQYHAVCTRLPLIDMCTPLSDRVLFGKFTPSSDSFLLVWVLPGLTAIYWYVYPLKLQPSICMCTHSSDNLFIGMFFASSANLLLVCTLNQVKTHFIGIFTPSRDSILFVYLLRQVTFLYL